MRHLWIALGAVAALVVAVADVPEGIDPWQPATTLAALVAVVALVSRHRSRPLGAVLALLALGGVALGAEAVGDAGQVPFGHALLVGVLLTDVARSSSVRRFAAVGCLAAVVAVAAELLADGRGWADAALILAIWGLAGAIGLAVRFWRQAGEAQMERTRIAERERIARELHDVVAHHVSAIAMTASGARSMVEVDPAQTDRALGAIHQAAATTLDEMRRMVAILRDGAETPSEVPQRLDDLVGFFSDTSATPVRVTVDGATGEPPAAVRAAVFRIAQEAVTNARRHALDPSRIEVAVVGGSDEVALTVSNDGRATPRVSDVGYGLQGMRERAELLGGTFRAGPVAGGGWEVCTVLPLESRP